MTTAGCRVKQVQGGKAALKTKEFASFRSTNMRVYGGETTFHMSTAWLGDECTGSELI